MKQRNFSGRKTNRRVKALEEVIRRIEHPITEKFEMNLSEKEISFRISEAQKEKEILEKRISSPESTFTKKIGAGRIRPAGRNLR